MSRIDLTGLRADLPIGAMAAFGCLRVCQRIERLRESRLSWERSTGTFHAVLWTKAETSREDLIAELVGDVGNATTRRELQWSEQIKTASPETFRLAAGEAIEQATAHDREPADWFAAFGSELALDDGNIRPTPFDMSVARQKFLADARKLANGLSSAVGKSGQDLYAEALFGPWKYQDDQHSLGWDPSTMKLGAFTYKAPTAMATGGVRAAVWLAFESLPLFPCFYAGTLQTRSFRRDGRTVSFCWPVWNPPLSLSALQTLLGWDAVLNPASRVDELSARGVVAIYRSTKFKPNKYLTSFRPPEILFERAADAT